MATISKSGALAVIFAICLGGCSQNLTFHGPDPIIGSGGPILPDVRGGLFARFAASATAAYNNDAVARQMLEDGYSLVYANCQEYFRQAGRTQQMLIFTRDMLGTLGTLATGVIALAKGGGDATKIAALITTTGYSVTDNISKDFLFASDNIDSVRELTLTKMSDFYNKTLVALPAGGLTYDAATRNLTDIQNYCTLRKIAALVKDAMNVAANEGSGKNLPALPAQVPAAAGVLPPLPPVAAVPALPPAIAATPRRPRAAPPPSTAPAVIVLPPTQGLATPGPR